MNATIRHPTRRLTVGITLLMYAGAVLFLTLRMTLPSDGTRLWIHPEEVQPSPVSAVPLSVLPTNLRVTDKVIGVEGKPIVQWANALLAPAMPSPTWYFGQTIIYTVVRENRIVDIPVTLQRYPLMELVRENLLTILVLVAIQAGAIWLFSRRPSERAVQTLLLSSSSLTAFSLCWFLGTDLAVFVNAGFLWLYYRIGTFILLMLMCASLLHFTLLLPRLPADPRLKKHAVTFIYAIPYPLYAIFLVISYTPDKLAWLTHWEQGIWILMIGCFFTGLLAASIKYHTSNITLIRRQLIMIIAALIMTGILVITVGWLPLLITRESNWEILPLVMLPIALSLVAAVAFYRLFDIRIAIQRTIVWGTLTAAIILVYIAVVGTLSILFNQRNDPILALIATGVVAVLFHPFRERLQRTVNKFIYGERDAPYQVIFGLTKRLEEALVPQAALNMIVETLCQALKLPYTAIELVENDHFIKVAEHGSPMTVPASEQLSFPLKYAEGTVGRLLISPRQAGEGLSLQDHRLISGLVHEAEVTIQTARLTVDLQRSREKIVVAREEERRHLRRDLHDGLGPSLASLMLQVDAARNLIHSDIPRTEAILLELKTQIQTAITDVRRIVYELRPPILDELGLIAALEEKARQLGQSAKLTVKLNSPTLPTLPAAVEGAIYRIALEALTNTIRHAAATECTIDIRLNGSLQLEICDNGTGLPANTRFGVGIRSMQERAAELGGTCTIQPRPDGGTCVLATLPIRSYVIPQIDAKGLP